MNCRVDTGVYGYAMLGVSVFAFLTYKAYVRIIDNEYKRQIDNTTVALHYALHEVDLLKQKIARIQGICDAPVSNVIEGTVDLSGYDTDSEDIRSESEYEESD